MTDGLHADPLLAALGELPSEDLASAQVEALRRRCHAALARRRRRAAPRPSAAPLVRVLEPALICGACAVFLSEILRRAAAIFTP